MTTLLIDIRRAETGDAAPIADVHARAWENAYAGLIPHRTLRRMVTRRGTAWWCDAIRRSAMVLVAEVDSVVQGYATLGRNRARALPQMGEIYELYLAPECQGVGLGRRLFQAARSRLRESHLDGLVVWALEENEGALRFYEGQGGRDVAEGTEVFEGRALRKIAFVWP